jgi:hypothetical protein
MTTPASLASFASPMIVKLFGSAKDFRSRSANFYIVPKAFTLIG